MNLVSIHLLRVFKRSLTNRLKIRHALLAVVIVASILGTRVVFAHDEPRQYGGGYIHGWVYGFNFDNYLLPVSWANVTATNGRDAFHAASGVNGEYGMFLPIGDYNVTATEPGYISLSTVVSVSDGSTSVINFYLYESHVPVPEFQSQFLSLVLMFSLAVVLLVKKTSRPKKRD